MGSSNDDSATNGDNSIGDPPALNSNLFSDGEEVLAYHGPCVYEAKVQKAEIRKNEWKYLVHYLGWNKNWDKWVSADRLVKHTEENILKHLALDKKQGVDKNPKSWRSVQNKPKFLSEAKVDKEDVKTSGTKGKKGKGESGPEKDIISEEKLVKIQSPSTLKKQLVDDREFITQQDKFQEACEEYHRQVRKSFTCQHCWKILRIDKKWQAALPNKRQKTSTDEDSTTSDAANLDRPLGRKATKEMQKNKGKSLIGSASSILPPEFLERKEKSDREKAERQERMLRLHQQQLDLQKAQYELDIIGRDTTGMSAQEAAYIDSIKQEILKKRGF